ncbi:MAG: DUF4168 domain-containing protein [Microcoleaceae cyanobacterium]
MKRILRCELGNQRWKLAQSLTIGSLSTLALMATVLPHVSNISGNILSLPAQAQTSSTFTAEEIRNYARAVLGMEPRRQAAYEEIRTTTGDNIPPVVCSQNRSINRLQTEIRAIAVNYCTQAKAIIESNGLTISQFNNITTQQQTNTQLQQQIQSELVRLQQSLGS